MVKNLRQNVEIKSGSGQVGSSPTFIPNEISFKQGVYDDEEGLEFHFIVFATNTSIFFYDPLVDNPTVRTLALGFRNIQHLATNNRRDFLFIIDYNAIEDKSIIYRYALLWNLTNAEDPIIFLNRTSRVRQYSGDPVSGVCVAEDNSYLFVADPDVSRIIRYEYTDQLWLDYDSYTGFSSDIFLEYQSVSSVNGISCDEASNELYWFNAPDGNEDKSILWRGSM